MNDKEWSKRIEEEITSLKDRVKKLEGGPGCQYQNPKTITLAIEWPEADIGGLHFNAQKTRSVFELKEDGNYYSRDILIHSARDTEYCSGCFRNTDANNIIIKSHFGVKTIDFNKIYGKF